MENYNEVTVPTMWPRDHSGDLGVEWRITLTFNLEKQDVTLR